MQARRKERFMRTVYEYYRTHKRSLPWRMTKDPYRILVSEVMLQQTQVERVVPFYRAFLRTFPTIQTLVSASLRDVLISWQGLGYNRRAKLLHQCARQIGEQYGGRVPRTFEELRGLPGIGPYTAGAILAFAYNIAHPIIETNIRTVYLHHFFKHAHNVTDREIGAVIAETLDRKHPRTWYWALMDYGAYLKKKNGNQNIRSASYARQSRFEGSDRQIRGALVRLLTREGSQTMAQCRAACPFDADRIRQQLDALVREGMVTYRARRWHLAT